MADCKHVCCSTAEKVWLPYELGGRSRGLKPHSYCIHCGVVRNISPDRAKVSVWRMVEYLRERNINPPPETLEEMEEGLARAEEIVK